VTPLLEIAATNDELLGHDRLAVVADPVGARPVSAIIEFRVVAVVGDRVRGTLHVSVRIHQVEIVDLARDRQGGLVPRILRVLRSEMRQLQVANPRVVAEKPFGGEILGHDGGGYRPVVSDIDLECPATTPGVDRVVVALHEGGVADRAGADHAHRRAGERLGRLTGPGGERAHAIDDARAGIGPGDVTDVAGIMLIPANEAYRRKR
jgi:hypothetical protein